MAAGRAANRAPNRASQRLAVLLAAVSVLAVFGFFGWAFYTTGGLAWTGGSKAIVVALSAGAVGVGALTGILMWLAFYSARKGYDDPPTFEDSDAGPSGAHQTPRTHQKGAERNTGP